MALPRILIEHTIDVRKMRQVGDRASDLRPAWIQDVQPIVTEFLTQRFATEGAFMTGRRWAPLAPATHELRKRPGHGRGGIGRDTNRMWASFVKSAGSQPAPGGVLLIQPDRYERGSSVRHALWFHSGYRSKMRPVQFTDRQGRRGWTFIRRARAKQIPPRPIIPSPLPVQLVQQVEAAIAAYVAGRSESAQRQGRVGAPPKPRRGRGAA